LTNQKCVTILVTLMAGNSRLATAIHIAGMLSFAGDHPMPSEAIAQSVGTNAVVVRRVIGLLVAGNIVKVKMGTGGGAFLARKAEEITLSEIYTALDEGRVFDVPQFQDTHECGIAKIVRPVLSEVLENAEKSLLENLGKTTLADIIGKVKRQLTENCTRKING
jgi:DNA-binding IscR family transcriptional regulator